MNEVYVICEPCIGVKDKACMDICPVNCIIEGEREEFPEMLFIYPDDCIGCGICEPECPVEAIYPEADVPEEWREYIRINADYFK
jgi:NAD-dependent dihydropyrimidine dehydrogenase PreA subunit